MSDFDDDEFDMDDDGDDLPPVPAPEPSKPAEPPKPPEPVQDDAEDDVGDDPATMFADGTLKAASVTRAVVKPWMKHHKFVLVKTVEEVVKIVDDALAAGECSLDLETQGFDNRINYDENGVPSTPHKIVGYCISVDGVTGYYLPVRHRPDRLDPDKNPNIPDIRAVEEQIKRLCLASQPELDPESAKEDPLAGKVAVPGKVVIYFWHSKFDQEFLYPVTGIDYWHPSSFHDGMLAAFTIFSGDKRIGLKPKAKQLLRTPDGDPYEMVEMKELFERGQKVDFAGLDPANFGVMEYVGGDGICTLLLCKHPAISKAWTDKKYAGAYQMEKKVVQVVRVMDRNRVKIDLNEVAILIEEAKAELAETEKRIVDVAKSVGFKEFNPGSPPQVSDLLFTSKGFDLEPKPPLTKAAEKEGTQQYSTSADILEKLAEDENAPDILVDIVKWRQIDKIIGTYLEGMLNDVDEHDQLRFDFKQTGTTTGRFSAPAGKSDHGGTSIPIHGIPARKDPKRPKVAHSLRRLFISRPGYTMVKSDYAGQELRIVTNLSREPVWLKEFIHGTGDLHTITAQAFFGAHITRDDSAERKMGKAANFALVYGGGPAAIMRATGCNKQEARRRKQNFDKKVSKFATWVKGQHAYVKANLGVKTASGRWISIPDANCKEGTKDSMGRFLDKEGANKLRAACERYSTNYPIQGSGADVLKVSFILLHREFYKRGWLKNGLDCARILLNVHDEIVFEIRDDMAQEIMGVIEYYMEEYSRMVGWEVPLIVEPLLGRSWAATYDWRQMKYGEAYTDGDKVKDTHFVRGNKVYSKTPDWLDLKFDHGDSPTKAEDPKPSASFPKRKEPPKVVVFKINKLDKISVQSVAMAAMKARFPETNPCSLLHLVDIAGNTLIGTDFRGTGLKVDAEVFGQSIREQNLGNGVPGSLDDD